MQQALGRMPGRAARVFAVLLVCALPLAYLALFLPNCAGAAFADALVSLGVSFLLAIAAQLFIAPLSLCYAFSLFALSPSPRKRILMRVTHFLNGIPPVACALAILAPALALGGGPSVFIAVLSLAAACLPRACSMQAQALGDVPDRYLLACVSLGATRAEATRGIVLRHARRPMIAACLVLLATAMDQLALMQLALGLIPGLFPATGALPLPSLLLSASASGDTSTAAFCALLLLGAGMAFSLAARWVAKGNR